MATKIVPENAILIPDHARRVFQGEIFDVYQWPQQLYDGTTVTFEMARRADSVEALCVVDGKILVLDDLQPNRDSRLTFPGGRQNGFSEAALDAAKREVREETGFAFKNWRLVSVTQPFGKLEWFHSLFVAWDGERVVEPDLDAGEKITVKRLAFDEVRQLVLDDAGKLGYTRRFFESAHTLQDILALPEFTGKTIDR